MRGVIGAGNDQPPTAPAAGRSSATASSLGRRCASLSHGISPSECQPRGIAANLVGQKALDHRRILGVDHRLGADRRGDHAAAIDNPRQHHRHAARASPYWRSPLQIHLGRRPCAPRRSRGRTPPPIGDSIRPLRSSPIRPSRHFAAGSIPRTCPRTISLPRGTIATGFQQHRVHIDMGFDPRRHRFGLPAPARSRRHQGGGRAAPPIGKGPTQPRDQHRLADVGRCPESSRQPCDTPPMTQSSGQARAVCSAVRMSFQAAARPSRPIHGFIWVTPSLATGPPARRPARPLSPLRASPHWARHGPRIAASPPATLAPPRTPAPLRSARVSSSPVIDPRRRPAKGTHIPGSPNSSPEERGRRCCRRSSRPASRRPRRRQPDRAAPYRVPPRATSVRAGRSPRISAFATGGHERKGCAAPKNRLARTPLAIPAPAVRTPDAIPDPYHVAAPVNAISRRMVTMPSTRRNGSIARPIAPPLGEFPEPGKGARQDARPSHRAGPASRSRHPAPRPAHDGINHDGAPRPTGSRLRRLGRNAEAQPLRRVGGDGRDTHRASRAKITSASGRLDHADKGASALRDQAMAREHRINAAARSTSAIRVSIPASRPADREGATEWPARRSRTPAAPPPARRTCRRTAIGRPARPLKPDQYGIGKGFVEISQPPAAALHRLVAPASRGMIAAIRVVGIGEQQAPSLPSPKGRARNDRSAPTPPAPCVPKQAAPRRSAGPNRAGEKAQCHLAARHRRHPLGLDAENGPPPAGPASTSSPSDGHHATGLIPVDRSNHGPATLRKTAPRRHRSAAAMGSARPFSARHRPAPAMRAGMKQAPHHPRLLGAPGRARAATRSRAGRGDDAAKLLHRDRASLDDEMRERIARHVADRDARWTTVEAPLACRVIAGYIAAPTGCLPKKILQRRGNALAAAITDAPGPVVVGQQRGRLRIVLRQRARPPLSRAQGTLNQRLAQTCDATDLVVGALRLSGEMMRTDAERAERMAKKKVAQDSKGRRARCRKGPDHRPYWRGQGARRPPRWAW
ncbi:cobP [Acanthosepion pharaonis]|uniref:CobP n=1 Tax=Acanthosepion pharaonis TaxID=158019 RepID=A0A812DMN6_ACAPH|nr:cobP [Sepia pharaonis]